MLPTLTIMDCYRVLLRNGPTGGNLEDVALKKTVVARSIPWLSTRTSLRPTGSWMQGGCRTCAWRPIGGSARRNTTN